jgi:hypothetical protein
MVNINDPVAAARLFSEIDHSEDPMGRAALKSIDFRAQGMFFPDKEFSSAQAAA